ncbi:hypothetical protein ACERII_10950 [Evansella sp. AB-rgal1]|uniref:hypothetical protein n=1 Tax=Evansella sp. AB-rgal1 TaxID=3242696 RepID=UPI00359E4577
MPENFINITLFIIGSMVAVFITIKIILIFKSYSRTSNQESLEKPNFKSKNECLEEENVLTDVPMELPWEVKSSASFDIREYERPQRVPLNRDLKVVLIIS